MSFEDKQPQQQQPASRNQLSLTKSLPVTAYQDSQKPSSTFATQPQTESTRATPGGCRRFCQRSNSARYQVNSSSSNSNKRPSSQDFNLSRRNNSRIKGSSAMLSVNNSLGSRNNSIISTFCGKLSQPKRRRRRLYKQKQTNLRNSALLPMVKIHCILIDHIFQLI